MFFPDSGMGMKLTVKETPALKLPDGKTDQVFWDAEIPGFGIRLRAGGSRVWVFQFSLGNKQRRMTLGAATKESFSTIKDPDGRVVKLGIREQVAHLHARVKLGQDPATDKAVGRKRAAETFEAVTARFLAFQKGELRPGSYRQVERHIRTHAKPLHGLALPSIDRRTVAAVITDIKVGSGTVAANRTTSTLSYFFTWAMGQGLAEANPLFGIAKFAERPRERVLCDTELRLVWNAAGDDHFGAIIKLLMLTGQRADEIASLRWSEVGGDAIMLPSERTKNHRAHVVPLPALALDILRAQQRRANNDGVLRDLVFGVGQRGFSGWSRCKARLDKRIAEENGKPLLGWRIHDLRRSVATGMAALGIQPHIIEAVLNHVTGSRSAVSRIYNRSTYEPEKRRALDLWGSHVTALANGEASNLLPVRVPA
jgi:integrase